MTEQHPDVREYLKRLDQALGHLPRDRRREIVGEIEAHIAQELQALGREPRDHEISDVLEALGDPGTIAAAEAAPETRVQQSRGRGLEVAALILLLVGAIVLPLLGWIVGVVLLWSSSVWTTRDKLLGTFVLPGGLAFPLYLFMFAGGQGQSCIVGTEFKVRPGGPDKKIGIGQTTCETIGISRPMMTALVVVLCLATIATVMYLARRMNRLAAH